MPKGCSEIGNMGPLYMPSRCLSRVYLFRIEGIVHVGQICTIRYLHLFGEATLLLSERDSKVKTLQENPKMSVF